ncbi:hypothetical protein [Thermosediminibacter oceani]|uniref:Uncharacterized protein n=1 Tax=Thermosediminibacter oceani (strain ATCC BAA-1034 / DSM 16646 / JW/IW-1228P) TaxID=555079 RepID=D9S151_THEOJ|nr:hypothetical protein [Thermosediminibacter oceani]ADL08930.1 hypothetical protein Toce_2218 [Thermosediminibacter oceani DSM 16646]
MMENGLLNNWGMACRPRDRTKNRSMVQPALLPGPLLKAEGVFITQQVGGLNDREINELLGAPESPFIDWNLEKAAGQLKRGVSNNASGG